MNSSPRSESNSFPRTAPSFPPQLNRSNCASLIGAMTTCSICDGIGLIRVKSDAGLWVSRPCDCQQSQREERRVGAAHIPERYRHYTLDGYETDFRGANQSLGKGLLTARRFVDEFPHDTGGKGLLFTGSIGVGKTHLAVGVLRRLVLQRRIRFEPAKIRPALVKPRGHPHVGRRQRAREAHVLREIHVPPPARRQRRRR